jgi:hypothetical protein
MTALNAKARFASSMPVPSAWVVRGFQSWLKKPQDLGSLAVTLYHLGDFEASGQNAMRGVRIWRSGNVQSDPEDVDTPVVSCLWHVALSEWHLGEIASSQATMAEAKLRFPSAKPSESQRSRSRFH